MSDKINVSTDSGDNQTMSEVTGTPIGTKTGIDVNVLNSLLAGVNSDAGTVAYPTATQEVYSFRSGGTGGTITATVTLNYTDSTKADLLNWAIT